MSDRAVSEPEPAIESARYEELAGWYAGSDRTILLTHMPEADFGEPMVLVRDGDRVFRAYPRTGARLAVDDGSTLQLDDLRRSPDYRERHVTFESQGSALAGTLITPTVAGLHPGVVLVHGAAGGQRDFCRLFAQEFLEAGIATLIYDKRGHGRSEGSPYPTIFDQAAAASAAIDFLKTQSDLDSSRIGLSGFSNGMWAVPMVAASRSDVAFVAGIGSPGVTMAESEIHRRVKVLREAKFSADALQEVETAWRALFSIASAGAVVPEVKDDLTLALAALAADDQARAYEPPGYARQNPMLSPLPPAMSASELVQMIGGAPNPELDYDPIDDYRAIDCPVLLQFGECDTSVPTTESLRRLTAGLALSSHSSTYVYPGLEHMLNVACEIDGLSSEETMYRFRQFLFGDGVWADLHAWLAGEGLAR
jgi:pimeloyl-ACP methyl ester carboxylesterase